MSLLSNEHLDALDAVLEKADPLNRNRLLEIRQQLALSMAAGLLKSPAYPESPPTTEDLEPLHRLVRKGLLHNGLYPELNSQEVRQAIGLASELSARAMAAHSLADQLGFLQYMHDCTQYQLEDQPDRQRYMAGIFYQVLAALGLPNPVLPDQSLPPA